MIAELLIFTAGWVIAKVDIKIDLHIGWKAIGFFTVSLVLYVLLIQLPLNTVV
jgi:hypothetical protein